MLLRPLPSSFQFPISSNPTSSLLTKPIRLHPRSLCTPAPTPTPVPDPTPTPASDSTATGKTRRPRRPTNSVDIIWGTRASRYFEKQPIENVEVDGVEIDWEGELDKGFVHEINFLEWESVAFHPSPLVVIVFERYKRAMENWNFMREFQKAAKVFWSSKDRLPPRTVRLDINIETDLAHALKVREAPQVLFLRGNRILYREKEFRTADDLVKMIAFFYYNARMPPCINEAKVARYPF